MPKDAQAAYGKNFQATAEVMERFWRWVGEQEILTTADLEKARQDPLAEADAARAVHTEVLNATLGLEAGYRVAIEGDDQILAAIQHLDDATDIWEAWEAGS